MEFILLFLVIVETCQVAAVLYNMIRMRRQLDAIISDPKFMGQVLTSMILGFMERVGTDDKDRTKFFSFIAACGDAAYQGVMERLKGPAGTAGPAGSEIAGISEMLPKKFRWIVGLLENPMIQGFIGNNKSKPAAAADPKNAAADPWKV